MAKRISTEEAISLMRDGGLEPLAPFENNESAWLCRCLVCGNESSPSLKSVRNRKSKRIGCRHCAPNAPKSDDQATSIMRDANLEPLEPYVNSTTKWKCKCLSCGSIVFPMYNSIKRGQGGCVYCAGNIVNPEDAEMLFLQNNLQPLVPYPGAGIPWKSQHKICGREVEPTYSNVRAGHSGCKYCVGNFIDEEKARQVFITSGLLPIEPYRNALATWKSIHQACGRIVTPRYNTVQQGSSGCQFCAGNLPVSEERAVELFREKGLEPQEGFPGTNKSWKCIHLKCGKTVFPRYAYIQQGQSGCGFCSRKRMEVEEAVALFRDRGLIPLDNYENSSTPWRSIHLKCGREVAPSYNSIQRGGGGCGYCVGNIVDAEEAKKLFRLRQNDPTIYYSLPTTPAPVAAGNKLAKLYDSAEFAAKYTYTGNDLGNTYSTTSTKFRVWAPTAIAVTLVTYEKADSPLSSGVEVAMTSDINGTWVTTLSGDKNGLIYNYRVTLDGANNEAVDPYVRATTINGERGVVVDLSKTNPVGWSKTKPKFSGKPTDAVIYELHVRDLSMDASSGISTSNRGKFLAFTERNTKSGGVATGVSAIKDLGVTHVELLPVYDYASVDEAAPTFNWGYDPQNYNVPEGSYSSDPRNPTARITELKSAILAMHKVGLRVNMDVVYNHVYNSNTFSQNLIIPGYFFRTDENGTLTNGSGCGNDVASERPMVRKFIVDSVKYWASEYNFDGFRFDLMGLMDIKTINEVSAALKVIDPTIIIIGEGWEMGTLPQELRASQTNIAKLSNVAHFNDQIRDGLKGSVFKSADTGWATGKTTAVGDIYPGIAGNTLYNPAFLNKWVTSSPAQSVNYVESHDNLTLADKLSASVKGISPTGIAQISHFATSVAFLSQGVPFMQAGQEFLRSKNGDENSYKSDDATNSLKWSTKLKYSATVNYYKGLIALRAAHPAFRMSTTAAVKANLKFLKGSESVIAYTLNGKAVGDKASTIVVIHNADPAGATVSLPNAKKWNIFAKGSQIGTKVLQVLNAGKVIVPGQSTMVLTQ